MRGSTNLDRQIPKIIHYCWFGGNPKSKIIEQCIASWKKNCPDWEIVEWNEDNFDISCVPYMKEAYEAQKWAFVSDVARLMIIYQSGGVYMDTDVELLDSIDPWIESNAFLLLRVIEISTLDWDLVLLKVTKQ